MTVNVTPVSINEITQSQLIPSLAHQKKSLQAKPHKPKQKTNLIFVYGNNHCHIRAKYPNVFFLQPWGNGFRGLIDSATDEQGR